MPKLILYIFFASLFATYSVASDGQENFDGKMRVMAAFLPQQIALNQTGKHEKELLSNMETFAPTIEKANEVYGLTDIWGAKIIVDDFKKQLTTHHFYDKSNAEILDRIAYCIRYNTRTCTNHDPQTIKWLSAVWNFYQTSEKTAHPFLLHEFVEHVNLLKGDLSPWNNGFAGQLMLINALWVVRIHHHKMNFQPVVYQYEQANHI